MTLDDFFREAGLSPPAKSDKVPLSHIITKANAILEGRTWDSLSNCEKTRLGFLIFKNQIERLRPMEKSGEEALAKAVFQPETIEYKTLMSFIRKVGNEPGNVEDGETLRRKFLHQHPEWRDVVGKPCFSLFAITDRQHLIEPFVRFQAIGSVVCWCSCASNAILYYMMLTTGTARTEAIGQYGININRFMRNSFTEDEIFKTIFCNDGGYPDDLIDRLLRSTVLQCERKKDLSMPVYLSPKMSPDTIFHYVSVHIMERGPLVVCNFRVFPAYLDTSTWYH